LKQRNINLSEQAFQVSVGLVGGKENPVMGTEKEILGGLEGCRGIVHHWSKRDLGQMRQGKASIRTRYGDGRGGREGNAGLSVT